eukprot:3904619-Alexandrium_andersonii.AAC.1
MRPTPERHHVPLVDGTKLVQGWHARKVEELLGPSTASERQPVSVALVAESFGEAPDALESGGPTRENE